MRKRLHVAAVALMAAALSSGFSATPTLAATTTWTVTPGGPFTGSAGPVTLWDSHYQFGCSGSQITGSLKTGTGLTGSGIGTIKSIALCSDPSQTVAWRLNFLSYNPAAGAGATTANITKIHFTVSSGGCSFVVDGTSDTADNGKIRVRYANQYRRLVAIVAGSTLHFYDVSNCPSQLHNGDPLTITAYYAITPNQTITSP